MTEIKQKEQTGGQVSWTTGMRQMLLGGQDYNVNYDYYRRMRKQPTISLARALSAAPITAGTWTVEGDDDERRKLIEETILPMREQLVSSAMFGGIDFGWAPFEKVFGLHGKYVTVKKFKPLLQDITDILIKEKTGEFAGFEQRGKKLQLPYCLRISFRVEGTQWHGEGLLEGLVPTYEDWMTANRGATTYDAKIAGSHFVVYYPVGMSLDQSGTETENSVIAATLLEKLEGSGSIAVPRIVAAFVDELNADPTKTGWFIELLEDKGGRQPTFIERLKYIDTLFARGLHMPERSILEGQFGTKAEAGEHKNLAVVYMELLHQLIVRHVNWYAIDQVLALNWGESARGSVKLVATPLTNEAIGFLQKLYTELMKKDAVIVEELGGVDMEGLKDTIGVPAQVNDGGPLKTKVEGIDANGREKLQDPGEES